MRRRQAFARAGHSPAPQPPMPPPEPEELTATDLRDLYARHFGKPPHGRMKPETIKERLRNADLG